MPADDRGRGVLLFTVAERQATFFLSLRKVVGTVRAGDGGGTPPLIEEFNRLGGEKKRPSLLQHKGKWR